MTYPLRSVAAVQTADRTIEVRELEVPSSLPSDHGLLRVEANGVCGTDHEQYHGHLKKSGWSEYPMIPGHEAVGRVEWLGDDAAEALGVREGDRVVVEGSVPCRVCRFCVRGFPTSCVRRFTYGFVPLTTPPGLWGGMSEVMVLRPGTVFHRLPDDMPIDDAAYQNPLAAGFEWTVRVGETGVGDSVLIMGPGQRGLACALAAAEAGARLVIVTGLSRDRHKLDVAPRFGATHTIDVEEEDLVSRVRAITDGEMVDRVLDLTPLAAQPVLDAIEVAAPGGTVVLAGIKGMRAIDGFVSDSVVLKALRVRGALRSSYWATEQAIRTLSERRYPFDVLHTHTLPIERAEEAIRILGGEVPGEQAIHVTIAPSA